MLADRKLLENVIQSGCGERTTWHKRGEWTYLNRDGWMSCQWLYQVREDIRFKFKVK